MHIDTITSKQRGKVYTSILLRETFREGKRIRHRTLANLSHLPPATITLMRESLAGRIVSFTNKTDLCLTSAREYGASKALLDLARQLELHKIIYSRPEPWRESALAMIIGRIVFQGSKLSLVAQHRNSALWSLCGIEKPDVDQHCYETLDKLLARQGAIQAALIKRHLSDGCFVLYDLTTIWLEGDYDDSSLADYGYSKEGRRGNKQVLLGVLTNKDGIPVAGEVFRGNTAEQTTVLAKARLLAKENGIADLVLVADRGLLTPARIAEVKAEGMHAITALTHPQFRRLLRQGVIRPELFIPGEVVEVAPADEPGVRYLLCHNPLRADADSRRRADILLTVMLQLEDLTESNMRSTDALAAAVGALLAKYKVAKYIDWHISPDGNLEYEFSDDACAEADLMDGRYIIKTDLPVERLGKDEVVARYKSLSRVEQAFRNLKTVALETRPIYHRRDDRIRAHVFLCLLAYYVQWHLWERLQPWIDSLGEGRNREGSLHYALECLKAVQENVCSIKGEESFKIISSPDQTQQELLNLLKAEV